MFEIYWNNSYLDNADSKESLDYLLGQYRMAYGYSNPGTFQVYKNGERYI